MKTDFYVHGRIGAVASGHRVCMCALYHLLFLSQKTKIYYVFSSKSSSRFSHFIRSVSIHGNYLSIIIVPHRSPYVLGVIWANHNIREYVITSNVINISIVFSVRHQQHLHTQNEFVGARHEQCTPLHENECACVCVYRWIWWYDRAKRFKIFLRCATLCTHKSKCFAHCCVGAW